MDKSKPPGGDSRRTPPDAGTPPAGSGAEAYARWLESMQNSRGRHAAITRNLYSWSNYKSWAEKIKGSFEPGNDKK